MNLFLRFAFASVLLLILTIGSASAVQVVASNTVQASNDTMQYEPVGSYSIMYSFSPGAIAGTYNVSFTTLVPGGMIGYCYWAKNSSQIGSLWTDNYNVSWVTHTETLTTSFNTSDALNLYCKASSSYDDVSVDTAKLMYGYDLTNFTIIGGSSWGWKTDTNANFYNTTFNKGSNSIVVGILDSTRNSSTDSFNDGDNDWTGTNNSQISNSGSYLKLIDESGSADRSVVGNNVNITNYDILVAIKRSGATPQRYGISGMIQNKTLAGRTYWTFMTYTPSNASYLLYYLLGTQVTLNNTANDGTIANSWYWFRMQANETTKRGKLWLYGQTEPEVWENVQDNSTLTYGDIGIAYSGSGTSDLSELYIEDFWTRNVDSFGNRVEVGNFTYNLNLTVNQSLTSIYLNDTNPLSETYPEGNISIYINTSNDTVTWSGDILVADNATSRKPYELEVENQQRYNIITFKIYSQLNISMQLSQTSSLHEFGYTYNAPDMPAITSYQNSITDNNSLNITVNENQEITFNITLNQVANHRWIRDGINASYLDENNFTIVVIPDTQHYSGAYQALGIFQNITQWIVDNKDNENIIFVSHVGDLINDFDNISQLSVADDSISFLDNNISYNLVPGNHDYDDRDPRDLTTYLSYFGYGRVSNFSYFRGYNGTGNTYGSINLQNKTYIFIGLEDCPTNSTLTWFEDIVVNNLDKEIILTTHQYLNTNGIRTNATSDYNCGAIQFTDFNSGDDIWTKVISKYPNIKLVLSGHMPDSPYVSSKTDYVNGNPIVQTVQDYQAFTNGGNGYIMLYQFKPRLGYINATSYSPYLTTYRDEDNFTALYYNNTDYDNITLKWGTAGTKNLSVYVENDVGASEMITFNITVVDVPLESITNATTTTGHFWIRNNWVNPNDADFNHTWFRYENGTTITEGNQTGTFLNITYYPNYVQNISAQTVDTSGNINETKVWFNATVPDEPPNLITYINASNDWSGLSLGTNLTSVQDSGYIELQSTALTGQSYHQFRLSNISGNGVVDENTSNPMVCTAYNTAFSNGWVFDSDQDIAVCTAPGLGNMTSFTTYSVLRVTTMPLTNATSSVWNLEPIAKSYYAYEKGLVSSTGRYGTFIKNTTSSYVYNQTASGSIPLNSTKSVLSSWNGVMTVLGVVQKVNGSYSYSNGCCIGTKASEGAALFTFGNNYYANSTPIRMVLSEFIIFPNTVISSFDHTKHPDGNATYNIHAGTGNNISRIITTMIVPSGTSYDANYYNVETDELIVSRMGLTDSTDEVLSYHNVKMNLTFHSDGGILTSQLEEIEVRQEELVSEGTTPAIISKGNDYTNNESSAFYVRLGATVNLNFTGNQSLVSDWDNATKVADYESPYSANGTVYLNRPGLWVISANYTNTQNGSSLRTYWNITVIPAIDIRGVLT